MNESPSPEANERSNGDRQPPDPDLFLRQAQADKAAAEARKAAADAVKAEAEAEVAKRAAASSTEQERLDAEKDAAAARQSIAEADKAARDALFPTSSVAPLTGAIGMDDKSGVIADLVASQALREATHKVAATIETKVKGKRILILDSLDFGADDYVRLEVDLRLTQFESELQRIVATLKPLLATPELPTQRSLGGASMSGSKAIAPGAAGAAAVGLGALSNPVILGLTAAASGISLATGVASYFNTDYSIKGRSVELSSTAVVADLAGALVDKGAYVQVIGFGLIESSALVHRFSALLDLRAREVAEAERKRSVIAELDKLKTKVADLTQAIAKAKPEDKAALEAEKDFVEDKLKAYPSGEIDKARSLLASWDTMSQVFDAWAKSVVAVAAGSRPPLVVAAIMETVRADRADYLLIVEVTGQGAEATTSHSIWFWANGRQTLLGAVALSYVLAEPHGNVVAADTVHEVRRVKYDIGRSKIANKGRLDLS